MAKSCWSATSLASSFSDVFIAAKLPGRAHSGLTAPQRILNGAPSWFWYCSQNVPLVTSGHGPVGLSARSRRQWAAVSTTFGLMNCPVHSTIARGSLSVGSGIARRPTHLSGARLGLPVVASAGAVSGITCARWIQPSFSRPTAASRSAAACVAPMSPTSASAATAKPNARMRTPRPLRLISASKLSCDRATKKGGSPRRRAAGAIAASRSKIGVEFSRSATSRLPAKGERGPIAVGFRPFGEERAP